MCPRILSEKKSFSVFLVQKTILEHWNYCPKTVRFFLGLFHFVLCFFGYKKHGQLANELSPKVVTLKGMASPSLTRKKRGTSRCSREQSTVPTINHVPLGQRIQNRWVRTCAVMAPVNRRKNGVFFFMWKNTFNTLSFRSVTKLVVVRFCWIFFWDWKCQDDNERYIHISKKSFFFCYNKQSTGLARKIACMPPKVACRTVPASASTTLSSDRLFSVSCGGQICEPQKMEVCEVEKQQISQQISHSKVGSFKDLFVFTPT